VSKLKRVSGFFGRISMKVDAKLDQLKEEVRKKTNKGQ
jgi:hypothetical protein